MRFAFIILGGFAGFLGLSLGFVISILALSSMASFGVPYLSPLAPREKNGSFKSVFIAPLWKREHRGKSLKVKRVDKQPPISRKWTEEREEI